MANEQRKEVLFFYRDPSEEMARVLLFYDFYWLSFSLYRPTIPFLPSTPASLASFHPHPDAKRVETGRAVNYQEGILIKFFIVAVRLQPEGGGGALMPRGDSTLPRNSRPVLLFSIRVPESLIRSNNSTLAKNEKQRERTGRECLLRIFMCLYAFVKT